MPPNTSSRSLPFSHAPKRLCILRLSAVGDICHAVPVVRSIQRQWPDTHITWVIGKLEASLVGDLPGIEFIIFDKSRGWRAYSELRKSIQQCLNGQRFDALLQMQISIRSSIASLFIPADIKLGFDKERAKDKQWLFTNTRIVATPRQHVMDGLFGFAHTIGITDLTPHWEIPLPDAAHAYVTQQLPNDKPVLAISPCSSNRARNWRNWGAEGYAHVADYATQKYGIQVVLTGGPGQMEKAYGEKISALCKTPPINLIGQTNLKQLLAIIQRADAIITPDSGPAHMATTVATPVIGLYVTSNPQRTGPYLSQQWVVNKYPEALKAEVGKSVDEASWGQRVRNAEAMARISVGDVTAKLDGLFGK
ncbi:MAG: glycosyltransferase family 9 protein [Ectothiorhodospiraceae bacterium]|nr:glycosyltransferase family 9 protein [Ectothiorhodospiraceae bacterium]